MNSSITLAMDYHRQRRRGDSDGTFRFYCVAHKCATCGAPRCIIPAVRPSCLLQVCNLAQAAASAATRSIQKPHEKERRKRKQYTTLVMLVFDQTCLWSIGVLLQMEVTLATGLGGRFDTCYEPRSKCRHFLMEPMPVLPKHDKCRR